jgi:hypothetical protein
LAGRIAVVAVVMDDLPEQEFGPFSDEPDPTFQLTEDELLCGTLEEKKREGPPNPR